MKLKIYALAVDGDCGTTAGVFTSEADLYRSVIEQMEVEEPHAAICAALIDKEDFASLTDYIDQNQLTPDLFTWTTDEKEIDTDPTSDQAQALNDRQTATVLHALRIIQEARAGIRSGCLHAERTDNASAGCCVHFIDVKELTDAEIDVLCEQLNFSDVGTRPPLRAS